MGPIPVKPVALGFTVCREVGKFLTTYLCDLSQAVITGKFL
jgi:hypothetical protein